MPFTPTNRVRTVKKSNTGRKLPVGSSAVIGADAIALLVAECAIMSGQNSDTDTASQSVGIDPAQFPFGHSDAADGANIEVKSVLFGNTANLHVNQVSKSYASPLNDGSIDITAGNAIQNYVTKYNSAHGTDYKIVHARYTAEG